MGWGVLSTSSAASVLKAGWLPNCWWSARAFVCGAHSPGSHLHIRQPRLEPLQRLQLGADVAGKCADGGILHIAQQVLNTCSNSSDSDDRRINTTLQDASFS